jgi:hypothetical protein
MGNRTALIFIENILFVSNVIKAPMHSFVKEIIRLLALEIVCNNSHLLSKPSAEKMGTQNEKKVFYSYRRVHLYIAFN